MEENLRENGLTTLKKTNNNHYKNNLTEQIKENIIADTKLKTIRLSLDVALLSSQILIISLK